MGYLKGLKREKDHPNGRGPLMERPYPKGLLLKRQRADLLRHITSRDHAFSLNLTLQKTYATKLKAIDTNSVTSTNNHSTRKNINRRKYRGCNDTKPLNDYDTIYIYLSTVT